MKKFWSNSVFPIAAIFSFRMLGLFMLIPVFTVYATHLTAATPALIGFALGGYGLSQGLLQIPFGILSDRFGRKLIITCGLLLFASGSLLGALSDSIYGIIFARILQGTGAIGSVLMALLADLTPEKQRTKTMAVIGASIGLSFSVAMVVSPIIASQSGLAGIFFLTTFLAIFGLLLLHVVIPTPQQEPFHQEIAANPTFFKQVIKNPHLQRLNLSIFCQHFILTATFFAVPFLIEQQLQLGHLKQQWHFYLPLMFFSFLAMIPFIFFAEKKRQVKRIFLGAVAIIFVSQLCLAFSYHNWFSIAGYLFTYFVAFNFLEATIPSLISKQASGTSKGSAMGVYSSSQFLGIFVGGTIAGLTYQFLGMQAILFANACIAMLWLLVVYPLNPEAYHTTLIIAYHGNLNDPSLLEKKLYALTGVENVKITVTEGVIYVRVNKAHYVDESADQLIAEYQAN